MFARQSLCVALAAILLAGLVSLAQAQDQTDVAPATAPTTAPADATGTWKWTIEGRDGQTLDVVLKLKQDGEKLTGTITGFRGEDTEITDGTVKGDELAFKVVRKWQDREFVTKYIAQVVGDTLKGKTEMERNGQTRTREFEAKRVKE